MIQRYIQSYYSQLIEIWEKSVTYTHDYVSKEDYDAIRAKLPQYFEKVDVYVYRKAGKIVAFMGVSGNKMEMLFCHPDYFRQGIGTAMVHYAIQFLHIKYIDVHVLNQQALDFYKNLGFIVIGEQNHDYFGYSITHLMYNG